MSKENVKLFYEALAKDKALQNKTADLSQKYKGQKLDEKQTKEIYQKELIPLARQAGYDFTLAELNEYASETKKPAIREVSEEELAGVAGGSQFCVCVVGGFGQIIAGGKYECECIFGGGGRSFVNGVGFDCYCIVGGGGG